MPNFSARLTAGATLAVWTDTPTASKPSRLNPDPAYPHKFRRVEQGVTVTAKATVGGVEGELDVNLGGDLFITFFAEVPLWPAPAVTNPVGQSSVATFTPIHLGHHLLIFRRQPEGGAIYVPFFVELTL